MFKFLLAALILSSLAYFGWDRYLKPQEPTVEERIATIRALASCTAQELAELAEANPKLVERELRGRIVSVSGVLARGLVKGVASTDLTLELEGTPNMKIDFHSDFHQFTRMQEGLSPGLFKFQKFGHEIVLMQSTPRPRATESSAGEDGTQNPSSSDPVIKFREGDHYTLKGLFQHIGGKRVRLQLREMP